MTSETPRRMRRRARLWKTIVGMGSLGCGSDFTTRASGGQTSSMSWWTARCSCGTSRPMCTPFPSSALLSTSPPSSHRTLLPFIPFLPRNILEAHMLTLLGGVNTYTPCVKRPLLPLHSPSSCFHSCMRLLAPREPPWLWSIIPVSTLPCSYNVQGLPAREHHCLAYANVPATSPSTRHTSES